MVTKSLTYEVISGENVPGGLPRLHLVVLSPIWEGPSLQLEYPDGCRHTLVGWTGAGEACSVRVFWTRHQPEAPAVCLAIGGEAGLRDQGDPERGRCPQGMPFLALAESLIPADILAVIGPPPVPIKQGQKFLGGGRGNCVPTALPPSLPPKPRT